MSQATVPAITTAQNLSEIGNLGSNALQTNTTSRDRCLEVGNDLLRRLTADPHNEALDQEAAVYIDRCRKTVTKMNAQRAPVTQLFDQIRSAFTMLENEVSPTKEGTIPHQIQTCRNQFAAYKREEAQRKAHEEALKRQRETDMTNYRLDYEGLFREHFSKILDEQTKAITALYSDITLDNHEEQTKLIQDFPITPPNGWQHFANTLCLPRTLTANDCQGIRHEVERILIPKLQAEYTFTMESNRDGYLQMIPSKLTELKAIAAVSAEEAERRKAEIQLREQQEAERREAERKAREAAEAERMKIAQAGVQAADLFGAAKATVAPYQPKVAVKKRLVPLNAEAFPEIISAWWVAEGCTLSVEELSKIFKKQLAFCEKQANDKSDPTFIQSEHLAYEEEVKAK